MQPHPPDPLSKSYFPGSGIIVRQLSLPSVEPVSFEPKPGWAAQVVFAIATQNAGAVSTFHLPYFQITDEVTGRVFEFYTASLAASEEVVAMWGVNLNATNNADPSTGIYKHTARLAEWWLTGRFTLTVAASCDDSAYSSSGYAQVIYRRMQEM